MGSRTASSVTMAAAKADVMAVIADFDRYPQWVTAMRSAEVLETGADGRADKVRFQLDAGLVRDTYVLAYRWDGDSEVSWELAEPGSVVAEMSGGYRLAETGVAGTGAVESGAAESGAVESGAAKSGARCEVSYELTVDVRMPMPGLLKRKAEKMIIDTALKGLKAQAESRTSAGGTGGAR
ncbi:MAG TPA: SRPBCC family protein [Streptosporangiaceae bacterium]|nr:SRPBCC family protein [Streptosporangiaceae bacterium]